MPGFAIPPFLTDRPEPAIEDLLAHVLHAIDVAGMRHVGLGLDYWFGMEPCTALDLADPG